MLRTAREGLGLTLEAVAEATRVPTRQLQAIERNEFSALPGTPYAVGFARAYARAVGVDDVEIARSVREELGSGLQGDRYEAFEPVDPARVPPRALAWTAAIIAVLLAVGYGVWRAQFFAAPTDAEISGRTEAASPAATPRRNPATTPAPAAGPVVLTAINDVWLRIYDQTGTRLLERQMTKGETFTVPSDANNPMILTGRPDALAVTVGGRPVAPLGSPQKTISDVPISAAALLARPAPAPAAVPPPAVSPAPARPVSTPISAAPAPAANAAIAPNP